MKVGDMVYNSALDMNGRILGRPYDFDLGETIWAVLYDDGHIEDAYDKEVTLIGENQ